MGMAVDRGVFAARERGVLAVRLENRAETLRLDAEVETQGVEAIELDSLPPSSIVKRQFDCLPAQLGSIIVKTGLFLPSAITTILRNISRQTLAKMGKLWFFGGSFMALRRHNQPQPLAEPSHGYAREATVAPWSQLLGCETINEGWFKTSLQSWRLF